MVTGLEAGADEYLTKPVDQMSLVARVKSVLRIKELHDQVQTWNKTLEQRVQEHRSVAVGEDEAVAQRPRGIARIEAQMAVPELEHRARLELDGRRYSGLVELHPRPREVELQGVHGGRKPEKLASVTLSARRRPV